MKRRLRRYPYTSMAIAATLVIIAAAVIAHINVFELPGVDIIGIEQSEIGEILIAIVLVFPAIFVDRVMARQRNHESELHAEQLRVLHVTMRTVQDIVNNNLNQLQLLRVEAEGLVPQDTVTLFDQVIRDTSEQITALGNMKVFAEAPMEMGSGLAAGFKSTLSVDPV